MRRRAVLVAASVVLLGGAWLWVSAAQKEALDPVKIMPDTHKLLFENKVVRVIQAKVAAGGVEKKHSHPPGVTIYLADYTVEIKTQPDGKLGRFDRKFGSVSWSEAVVHEVKNVGKTASHAVRVELKY